VERLEAVWDGTLGEAGIRSARRLPLLWERNGEAWLNALRAFLAEDLNRISGERLPPAALEETVEGEIDLGDGVVVRLIGRFDRRLEGAGGRLIGDYKSSGRLDYRGDQSEMLKGHALQVPLYHLLSGEQAGVELLGVGPGYEYGGGDAVKAGRRVVFDGFDEPVMREGFLETVRVLVELAHRGRFPLQRESGGCDYCAYRQACRRTHHPTLERERNALETRDYYALRRKNKTRKPTLEAVRKAEPREGSP
jgi:hypothetical protein